MRISLKKTGDLPSYKKIFGYVLTYKVKYPNPAFIEKRNQIIANSNQSKFSKFMKKCLEKLFPECDVDTKSQFRKLYDFVDPKILDKHI